MIDDGLGLSDSQAKTSYSYSGGKWSHGERQFLGFAKINVFQPCNLNEASCPTTEITYRQDYAAAGEPERIDYRDGAGTLLRSLANSWVVNNTGLPYKLGTVSDLWGRSINTSVDIGPIGGTASWDTDGKYSGFSVSVGAGTPSISTTTSYSASSAKPDWGKLLGRRGH